MRAFCTLWDYDWFIVGGSEYFKCVCQISVNSIERGMTWRGGRRRRRAGDDDNAHCIRKQFQFSQCNPPTFSALPLLSLLSLLILLLNFGLGRNSLTLGQISWWICQVSKQNCAKNDIFFFCKIRGFDIQYLFEFARCTRFLCFMSKNNNNWPGSGSGSVPGSGSYCLHYVVGRAYS